MVFRERATFQRKSTVVLLMLCGIVLRLCNFVSYHFAIGFYHRCKLLNRFKTYPWMAYTVHNFEQSQKWQISYMNHYALRTVCAHNCLGIKTVVEPSLYMIFSKANDTQYKNRRE